MGRFVALKPKGRHIQLDQEFESPLDVVQLMTEAGRTITSLAERGVLHGDFSKGKQVRGCGCMLRAC